jgi:hypothetical protein
MVGRPRSWGSLGQGRGPAFDGPETVIGERRFDSTAVRPASAGRGESLGER